MACEVDLKDRKWQEARSIGFDGFGFSMKKEGGTFKAKEMLANVSMSGLMTPLSI